MLRIVNEGIHSECARVCIYIVATVTHPSALTITESVIAKLTVVVECRGGGCRESSRTRVVLHVPYIIDVLKLLLC